MCKHIRGYLIRQVSTREIIPTDGLALLVVQEVHEYIVTEHDGQLGSNDDNTEAEDGSVETLKRVRV